jgi:glycosyltransferase involved in cell wall biosynthesis
MTPPDRIQPMRLLGLTSTYPPTGLGGYAEICADVMEGLCGRGHQVELLALEGEPGIDRRAGVEVRRELRPALAAWRRPRVARAAEKHDTKSIRAALARGADAALVWHPRGVVKPPLRLLHAAGIPVLYMLHDRWVLYERPGSVFVPWARADDLAVRLLREPPIAREGIVCFNSRWLRDEHARLHWRPRDARIIGCGLPDSVVSPSGSSGPRGATRLLFAGRLDPTKGIEDALGAMAQLPEAVTLSVAGLVTDPAYAESLRQRAGERVRWLGELTREELFAAFAEHDVLVYPSREPESFGLGILEAQAAGLIAVTSAEGGPREFLVDGENCLLHRPGDVSGLVRAVKRLQDEPGLAARLRDAGRATARSMPLSDVVDQVEGLLRERTSRISR